VCGHIHEAYGVEVVNWDLSSSNVRFKEQDVREYTDPEPGSKKQFTVDLSLRAKAMALRNDGAIGCLVQSTELLKLRGAEVDGPLEGPVIDQVDYDANYEESSYTEDKQAEDVANGLDVDAALLPKIPRPLTPPFPDFEKAELPPPILLQTPAIHHLGTRGQGGPASSPRSDQEAISEREGRVETCMVNAAFMASNFPHKAGKRFHKPVVIDMDLPVAGDQDVDQAAEQESP
jgi:hypothetical protein